VNRLPGTALRPREIAELLCARRRRRGGRSVVDGLRCRPPSWRADLELPEDLIEEVARVHGYDRIEPTPPVGPSSGPTSPGALRARGRRDGLGRAGLVELMTSRGARGDLDALRLAADDRAAASCAS
jgi:phenylalanyl-tRNA synthetase beta chain